MYSVKHVTSPSENANLFSNLVTLPLTIACHYKRKIYLTILQLGYQSILVSEWKTHPLRLNPVKRCRIEIELSLYFEESIIQPLYNIMVLT